MQTANSKIHQLGIRTHWRVGWTLCKSGDQNCYVLQSDDLTARGGPYPHLFCKAKVESAKRKGMNYTCYKPSR